MRTRPSVIETTAGVAATSHAQRSSRMRPCTGSLHSMTRGRCVRSLLAAAAIALSLPAVAEVSVTDAWVRGTVTGQKTTGAFMQLSSAGRHRARRGDVARREDRRSSRHEDGRRHDENACRRQDRTARRQDGRLEAGRLSRDAGRPRRAAQRRRHRAAQADLRGQRRSERTVDVMAVVRPLTAATRTHQSSDPHLPSVLHRTAGAPA